MQVDIATSISPEAVKIAYGLVSACEKAPAWKYYYDDDVACSSPVSDYQELSCVVVGRLMAGFDRHAMWHLAMLISKHECHTVGKMYYPPYFLAFIEGRNPLCAAGVSLLQFFIDSEHCYRKFWDVLFFLSELMVRNGVDISYDDCPVLFNPKVKRYGTKATAC